MRTWLFMLLVAAILGRSSEAAGQSFPVALQQDATARACVPITDTSGYPGLERPLFLYSARSEDARALYWCARGTREPKSFLIVLRPALGCPDEIPYWNPPAGLTIEAPQRVRLAEYRPVLDPESRGPDLVVTAVAIRAEYDGAGGTFVCHGGRWFVAHFH